MTKAVRYSVTFYGLPSDYDDPNYDQEIEEMIKNIEKSIKALPGYYSHELEDFEDEE